jgi:pimeloyl-ACP methyl ester carboxylesterase
VENAPDSYAVCFQRWQHEARDGMVNTGRYRCRYYTWGSGPALIFLPGLSLESTSFAMPMAQLQTQFTCVGYELPTGDGDRARLGTYRHEDLRDDLFALMDHLQLERAHLLGFSFGSTVAIAALAQQPHRFPRGILVSGFARRSLAWAEVLLAHFVRYCPGRVAALPGYRDRIHRHSAEPFASRPPEELEQFCDAEGAPLLRTLAARALIMHRTDLRPMLGRIEQPILLVHGDRDHLVSRALQDELKRGLPSASRAEIENCGHYPQLTCPETFTEVVRQFLTPAACPATSCSEV